MTTRAASESAAEARAQTILAAPAGLSTRGSRSIPQAFTSGKSSKLRIHPDNHQTRTGSFLYPIDRVIGSECILVRGPKGSNLYG